MSFPDLSRIKDFAFLYSTRVPKAIGILTFTAVSFAMGRECCLIAQECSILASELSLQVLNQKSLESADKGLLQLGLVFSQYQPHLCKLAYMGIATFACSKIAYDYAKELVRPVGKA